MEIVDIVQILIYIHAFLGGIALISGSAAIFSKKGNKIHRKSGMIFYYSMLFSSLTALLISVLPKHESPYLFAIGIFSSYFILTGKRAINFKTDNGDLKIDKIISWAMIFTGIIMIFYNPIFNKKINIILTVYGLVGLNFSIRDLFLYKDREKLKNDWLKLHLGKMIGGYISATTAFVIVNNFFPSFYGWFIPGIFGGIYITYWIKKLNKKI